MVCTRRQLLLCVPPYLARSTAALTAAGLPYFGWLLEGRGWWVLLIGDRALLRSTDQCGDCTPDAAADSPVTVCHVLQDGHG
jgi:hypothetical protein